MLKVSSYSVHELIFVESDSKCHEGSFMAMSLTMIWGILWLPCPMVLWRLVPRAVEDFTDRPLRVLFLDEALWASLRTAPVSLVSWSRKILPLVASSHIQSHTIIIMDFMLNCISSLHRWLSYTLGNVRDNPSWNRQYRKQYANC